MLPTAMFPCIVGIALSLSTAAPASSLPDTALASAWRAYREGRFAAAATLVDPRLASEPAEVRSSALDLAARLAREREDYPRALWLTEERLRLWRGDGSPKGRGQWALAYVDRSAVHFRLSRFREAEADVDSAAAVAGDRLELDERLAASVMAARGNTLYHLGDVQQATRDHERALEIRRRLLAADDPDLAQSLINVGTMRWRAGDFDDAIRLDDEAMAGLEPLAGGTHPMIGEARSRKAYAERDRGDLAAARADWERAIEELRTAHGGDHTSVGRARAALSDLLGTLGDARASLALAESTLASARRRLPVTHRDVGRAQLAVGEARLGMGETRAARAALESGYRVIEAAVGPDNPDLDQALADLADLAMAERDTAAARHWLGRRLAINVRALGMEHPRVGRTLLQLGELRLAARDRAATLDTLRLAAAALAALGEADPAWAEVRAAMARVERAAGEPRSARRDALAAEHAGREHFRLNVQGLTTSEALRYARLRPRGLDLAIAALLASPRQDTAGVRECWDALVRSRALVLDELALRRIGLVAGDSATLAAVLELRRASARLAHLVARGAGGDSVAAWHAARDAAFARRESAERRLSELSVPFRRALATRQIGLADVESAMPPGTALVAYLRIAPGDGAARYVAFVRDAAGGLRCVALGDAGAIDALLERWRRELSSPPDPKRLEQALAACRAAGVAARERLWDPVAAVLGGARRTLVVRDGALLTLPLAALPGAGGAPLLLAGTELRMLDTERDQAAPPEGPAGHGLLAIGAPSFGCDTCSVPGPCGPASRLRFGPLPGAADELREVAARWQAARAGGADLCAGPCATVAALGARAPGHRALHVATHGWALEAPCNAEAVANRRGVGRLVSRPQAAREADDDPSSSPLLASGLALSPTGNEEGDGIVTADELAALDLAGVELVVLSACETGLGAVQSGEGVLGLKRAFRIAGARQLVVSLWSVDDRATRDWMLRFHDAWLRGGDATEAVRATCAGWLSGRSAGDSRRHPYYWAAFVASGR